MNRKLMHLILEVDGDVDKEFEDVILYRLEKEGRWLLELNPRAIFATSVKVVTEVEADRDATILEAVKGMDSSEVVDMMEQFRKFTPPDDTHE